MNTVRSLVAALIVVLAGMGTWVWKKNEELTAARVLQAKTELVARRDLALKEQQAAETLKQSLEAQQQESQKALQKQNEDFEKKLDDMRASERKRMASAFEQFGGLLEGNKKT